MFFGVVGASKGICKAMYKPEDDRRGLLNPNQGKQKFRLARLLPSEDLSSFIEHYWIVHWDLRGAEPYISETLPDPSIHLAIESGRSALYGVVTKKFSVLLQGVGRVFGIKFRPGAFYPFLKIPVSSITDRTITIETVFGADGLAFEEKILALDDPECLVKTGEDFLREHLPSYDENCTIVNQVIELISQNDTLLKVDDLVEHCYLNKRRLQRLFKTYVGVSPKWVIQRYRLHEAAEKLAAGNIQDWPTLALTLGYFDQAHFIKVFKAIVGKTPGEYARQIDR